MRTAQLIHVTVALTMAVGVGCNRAETQEQTQRAATDVKNEVKTAAARAGETLADGWLTTRIQAQYFADDQVKARYIDVNSKDGVVTVKGFVESPAAHERALQIARNTTGVKQVNDQILIGQSPKAFEAAQRPVATAGELPPPAAGTATVDDDRLSNAIQASFFLDPAVKARQIQVETHNGVVTLNGAVASETERAQALVLARNVQGVQRVEDNLRVDAALDQPSAAAAPASAPVVDDASLSSSVKAKFDGDAQLKGITVSASEGVLQLQGSVPTAAAHQRALAAARDTEGVKQVVDRLTVKRGR